MATNTGETVLNILQTISDWRSEASTNTDASRIRAVSRAERDVAKRRFWKLFLIRDQTMVGDGVSTDFTIGSALYPMRPKGLTEIFSGGTLETNRIQIVDFNTFKETYNSDNTAPMGYEWYDTANDLWKIHLNPIPSSAGVITYSYYWVPPKRTLVTDITVSPNPEILARIALADIYHGEDELQKEQIERQTAEQMIQEEIAKDLAPAVNQTYTMGMPTFRNRGIGTY